MMRSVVDCITVAKLISSRRDSYSVRGFTPLLSIRVSYKEGIFLYHLFSTLFYGWLRQGLQFTTKTDDPAILDFTLLGTWVCGSAPLHSSISHKVSCPFRDQYWHHIRSKWIGSYYLDNRSRSECSKPLHNFDNYSSRNSGLTQQKMMLRSSQLERSNPRCWENIGMESGQS